MAFKSILLLTTCAGAQALNSNATSGEQAVSVTLWDSNSRVAAQSGNPPRYVIGTVSIGGQSQHFTFDAGNPKEPILIGEGCVGCSDGCPSSVPTCNGGTACWSSHPNDYAPKSSYTPAGSCPSGVKSAGSLNGAPVCTQCFGGSSHSRFYTMVEVNGDATMGSINIPNLQFGALVRTAPATDRVWGDVGIGYKSHFMQQIGATSVLLHLRDSSSSIIFNPSSSRYAGAQSASFTVGSNREHIMNRMVIGSQTVNFQDTTFHIDTGDSGIAISDSSLLSQLQSAARSLTPSSAPDLTIVLNGMSISVPGHVWVTGSGSTCFFSYHKNVLGLPFITSADIVFDDNAKIMYIVGGSSPGPSPTPAPTPAPAPACRRRRCAPTPYYHYYSVAV